MEKVALTVLGLSASPAASNAYALILKETHGNRRLPIIIGAFEAQAIALEMEGVTPPRPMTHDLIKNMIDSFGMTLSEVYINDLVDGTFYAKLIFEDNGVEIDARPSDAVAIAIRCNTPVFVNVDILSETAIIPTDEVPEEPIDEEPEEDDEISYMKRQSEPQKRATPKSQAEALQLKLDDAIRNEEYEKAAQLRDELNKLRDN